MLQHALCLSLYVIHLLIVLLMLCAVFFLLTVAREEMDRVYIFTPKQKTHLFEDIYVVERV